MYMRDCNCFILCVKNLFIHYINVKGLKLTFGVREAIVFKGTPLRLRVWIGFVINLVTVGDLWY
jgi:hypothetical protein